MSASVNALGVAFSVGIAYPARNNNGEMHRAHDGERPSVQLIRPDGYLAFRADWTDRHVLLEFLETYVIRG